MDSSKNSSIAPLDYYKKLTHCLANRKQLKINLGVIPGVKEYKRQRPVRFTNERMNAKFLAKYSESQNMNQQQTSTEPIQNGFKFLEKKDGALEKAKRKKDESFLNLSPTFFKAYKGPDLSIFKIPDVPPQPAAKKLKLDNEQSNNKANFTIASLFSNNFNPKVSSTPIEKAEDHQQLPELHNYDKSDLIPKMPDLPIQPPAKKQKIENNCNMITSNFTISSLLSRSFNPQKSSTPNIENLEKLPHVQQIENAQKSVEKEPQSFFAMIKEDEKELQEAPVDNSIPIKNFEFICPPQPPPARRSTTSVSFKDLLPKPFISDPNEILQEVNATINFEKDSVDAKKKTQNPESRKKYDELITKAAEKWDEKCFFDITDPVERIQKQLLQIYQEKLQSPRPSLLSQRTSTPKKQVAETQKVVELPKFPLPVFYDNEKSKEDDEGFNDDLEANTILNDIYGDIDDAVFSLENFNIEDTSVYLKTPVSMAAAPQKNWPLKSKINETAALFSDYVKRPNKTSNLEYQCDNKTAEEYQFSPLVVNVGSQRDCADDSLFGSSIDFWGKVNDKTWEIPKQTTQDANIYKPSKFKTFSQPIMPHSSLNAFSVFQSPPRNVNSSLNLREKFKKAIQRPIQFHKPVQCQLQQTNAPDVDTIFFGEDESLNEYEGNESLFNDSSLFDNEFF